RMRNPLSGAFGWARIPGTILLGIAAFLALLGTASVAVRVMGLLFHFWPVLLILGGLWLFLASRRRGPRWSLQRAAPGAIVLAGDLPALSGSSSADFGTTLATRGRWKPGRSSRRERAQERLAEERATGWLQVDKLQVAGCVLARCVASRRTCNLPT